MWSRLHECLLPNGNLLVAQTPWSLPLPPGVPSNVKIKKQTWPNGQHADQHKHR